MAKNIIQDVIAKDKRSIRQISVNKIRRPAKIESRKIASKEDEIEEVIEKKEARSSQKEIRGRTKKTDKQKTIIWTIAMISFAFFLFSLSSYLSSATAVITPKSASIELNDSYSAKKNAQEGELKFETMTLRKNTSKQLEATETKNLQIKASGKIIVYNAFNSFPQRFIKNTRFESGNGLIYKIQESIDVPGKKTVAGKDVPGSIEALVFADEAGDKYNISASDQKNGTFKIVGLKGDRKYDYFYGVIKTNIAGGVNGSVKKVATKTYEDALSDLRAELKTELIKEAFSVKPESAVLFENGYYIDFTSLPEKPLGGNKVEITESASFYGIIFDKDKLSAYVADKKIPGFNGSPVNLDLSENAKASIGSDSKEKPWESEVQNLSLKGNAKIIWKYDKNALKKDLAGYPKNNRSKFLASHPELSDLSFIVRPFWIKTLPSNPEKIKIEDYTLR